MPSTANVDVSSTNRDSTKVNASDTARRQNSRFNSADASDVDLRCTLDVEDATLDATLVDVSEGGARLIVPKCLKFAELARLEVDVQGRGVMLDVATEVSFVRPLDGEEWLISCLFVTEVAADVLDDMANEGIIQRRRRERWAVDIPCVASCELGASDLPATIKDFGVEGFRLITTRPGTVGATVLVEVREPGARPDSSTTFSGNLCWQSEKDGAFQLGCAMTSSDGYEFLRRISTQTDRLERYSVIRRSFLLAVPALLVICLSFPLAGLMLTFDRESPPRRQQLGLTSPSNDSVVSGQPVARPSRGRGSIGANDEPIERSLSPLPAGAPQELELAEPHNGDDASWLSDHQSARRARSRDQESHARGRLSPVVDYELLLDDNMELGSISRETTEEVTKEAAPSRLATRETPQAGEKPSVQTGNVLEGRSDQIEYVLSLAPEEKEPTEEKASDEPTIEDTARQDLDAEAHADSEDTNVNHARSQNSVPAEIVQARNDFLRGQSLIRSRQFQAAMRALEKAVDGDPRQALYRYLLAMAYFELDQHVKADAMLEKAITCEQIQPVGDWGHRMSRFQGKVRQWVESHRSSRVKPPG